MKVFLSWSGVQSQQLAEAIRDWLPAVLQLVRPYFTPSDIEKGTRWSNEIAKELDESQIGILCVTRDNLHSDWILFEAGALSKSLGKSHVCPILFGISNTDLAGPLRQFQTTQFEKPDFHKLLTVINTKLGESKLPPKTLDIVFEKWWPELDSKISEILGQPEKEQPPLRSDRDMLEELLALCRQTSRNTSNAVPLSPGPIRDLVERFIAIHEQQANQEGGYLDALRLLSSLAKPVEYIVEKYKGLLKDGDYVIQQLRQLDYATRPKENEAPDDEVPF